MAHRLFEKLAEDLGIAIVSDTGLKIPEPCRLLWSWYSDLSRTRTYHQAGPNPISYAEIGAYAQTMGIPMRPDHIAAIRALDDAYLSATAQSFARGDAGTRQKIMPDLTPELFDKVFR